MANEIIVDTVSSSSGGGISLGTLTTTSPLIVQNSDSTSHAQITVGSDTVSITSSSNVTSSLAIKTASGFGGYTSADLVLQTGQVNGTGSTGSVIIDPGASTGGTSGTVQIRGPSLGTASNGNVLTLIDNTTGLASWAALAVYNAASPSFVFMDTGNGFGAVNTMIRRFTNTTSSSGSDISYTPGSNNGDYFLAATTGLYSITYTDGGTNALTFGISKNTTNPTTSIASLAAGERVAMTTSAAGATASVSVTIPLSVGDKVRAHTNGDSGANSSSTTQFLITRIA